MRYLDLHHQLNIAENFHFSHAWQLLLAGSPLFLALLLALAIKTIPYIHLWVDAQHGLSWTGAQHPFCWLMELSRYRQDGMG